MALIVLDAVLIRSPNLIGKIGLWFYKYHYLRTFPKALLTVFFGHWHLSNHCRDNSLCRKKGINKKNGRACYPFFISHILSLILLVKVVMVFSEGTYSHTGIRFKFGAYLLPAIIFVVFIYASITLPRLLMPVIESPVLESNNSNDDN